MTSVAEGGRGPRRLTRGRLLGLVASFAVLGAATLWRFTHQPEGLRHDFAGTTMGTSYHVTVDADLTAEDRARVRETIEESLDRVNNLMSTYDTASELSRFNRYAGTDPVPASAELLEVLEMAAEVSERSGGAFDVTVAPLVDAWGFGPSDPPDGTPDDETLAALRATVGYRRIVVDTTVGTVAKTVPETWVDLSAIAKGYGVDRVAAALGELGLTSFLAEVGGEVKAVGRRRDGRAWRVGIERPEEMARALYGVVELTDQALATSGDYRNYYDEGGVRYAHIIDPRSGRPILFHGASVTVAHPSTAIADAWATALTVLGPHEGFELARREGVAALFVTREDGAYRSRATPRFEERLEVSREGDR